MFYVLVTGNGETSRANVEALMEDVFYAKPDTTVVLAYESAPSKGQTYIAQYAAEAKKDLVVFCHKDAQTTGIPGATQSSSTSPVVSAIEFLKGRLNAAYILYSNTDPDSTLTVSRCVEAGIPVSDLCDGLVPLHSVPESTEVPEHVISEEAAPVVHQPKIPGIDLVSEIKSHLDAAYRLLDELAKTR